MNSRSTNNKEDNMVRIKNMAMAKELITELEALQEKSMKCFSMDDDDLNGDQDVYNKIYEAIQAINDIIGK